MPDVSLKRFFSSSATAVDHVARLRRPRCAYPRHGSRPIYRQTRIPFTIAHAGRTTAGLATGPRATTAPFGPAQPARTTPRAQTTALASLVMQDVAKIIRIPAATLLIIGNSTSAIDQVDARCFTGGTVHEPSRIDGRSSLGQYIRSIRMNFPAGAGSQFDFRSAPGESF
jgi:hypothetical protein